MTATAEDLRTTAPASQQEVPLPMFVVWIDTNCGHGDPDWEIDNPPGCELEPLQVALAHAAALREKDWITKVVPAGETPRPDGLMSGSFRS